MFNDAIQLLKENQNCLEILRAYSVQEINSKDESDSKWAKRIFHQADHADELEEETDQSSEAHGLLIAYGYLDIELAGRSDGIQYRLSSDGKRALEMLGNQEVAQAVPDEQRLAG